MAIPTPSPSRRAFVGLLAAAPLIPALTARAAVAPAPIARAGGPRLKVSLNAYSFSDLLTANQQDRTRGLDLFQLCDWCAEEGFDAIDPTAYFFPGYPQVPEDAYLFRLKRHAFDRGLAISGTGVRNDFATADRAVRTEGIARVKAWVVAAAKLGAPVVRVFAGPQKPHPNWSAAAGGAPRADVERWMADDLRECAEFATRHGVVIGVQNHGDFVSTGEEHLSLLARTAHPACGAIVDTGQYLTPDPYADIALVAPHAVNWQVKDTPFPKAGGPRTDLPRLVTIIRRSGYRGWVPIETLALGRKDYDPRREAAQLHREFRAAIRAAEGNG